MRIGLGYDKHLLVEGRKMMVGGIHIPFEKGEAGHSDGDVLLHAVTDALLGAAAIGDIGSFFPPNEEKWKDADSVELMKTAWKEVCNAGYKLSNLDCIIACEKPKILPYRDEIRKKIAEALSTEENPVSIDQIFVKGKTGEKSGEIGEGKACEAWASCLLEKR